MNIVLENISKEYNTGFSQNVIALKNVSLVLNSGDAVSVIGPSGAGKSTLLHIIGLMDTPSSGNVVFDGVNASAMSSAQKASIRKSKLGFLFQFHHLLPEFTVLENILLPSWETRAEKLSTAINLLKVLGIENRSQHLPSQLSGGEAQRAALARALINSPDIILADEPTGNLDRETGVLVENLLFSLCEEKKISLVLVTHNEEIAQRTKHTFQMRDGKIENVRQNIN
ncbi:MAG: ABC transporter ATP-binding protein [Endomicrobiales bacterium]|nr:ABC transporter ATP-binding protein [Endomicrobiales bacterium]